MIKDINIDTAPPARNTGDAAPPQKYGLLHPNTIPGKIEQLVDPVLKGVAMFFYALFNVVFVLLPFLFDYIINHTKSTATSVTTDSAVLDTSAAYQAASAVLDTRADYVRTRAAYNAACDTADGADSDVEAAYDAACDAFLPLYEAAIAAYGVALSACDAYDVARDAYDAALRSGVRPDTDAYTAAIAACTTTQNAKIVAAETYRTLEPDLFALMRR